MRFMAKNIAVLGDSESIKGFSAIGLDIFPCDGLDEASTSRILRNLADSEDYSIIYVTEEYFNKTEKERSRYEERITPAIIPIPGVKGNENTGRKRLSSFVEKAVGSDIIFNN